ncbi:MAG: SpoIID/LytB domain-containing protein [Elusimicrobiota bacterium]
MNIRGAGLMLLLALPSYGADAEQTTRDSYGAFLQGRYDDSASGWRYLAGLGVVAPHPEANEAISLRDAGKPESALPMWIKASLTADADGFIWNQRAWSSLALGRTREAKESFEKAVDRSSTTATQAEANLGQGLAALINDQPKAALEPLRRAAIAGPYAISAAALLTAEISTRLGDRQSTLSYLRQALDVDPYDREALRGLARLLDKIGDNKGAWLAARRALALDPTDSEAIRTLKRNAGFIIGDPDEASGVRRIARPVLNPDGDDLPLPAAPRPIRVGLYGAPNGKPATMTRCYLMMNSSFKVTAAAYGVMRDNGNAFDQWEIEMRPETGVIEVRDSARNLLFVSKQPFKFVPSGKRGSVLIKSPRITDIVGVDIGDREVRGAVEVVPNPWGFELVQEVPLELYLYGVVSLALPDGSPPEAFRAQAVVSRTAAMWAVGHRAQTIERMDLLDDRTTQATIGVSGEMHAAAEAVAATEGMVLAEGGMVARAPQHDDSGGRTEDGRESGEPGMDSIVSVVDAAQPLAEWTTPLDLERFVHDAPPTGLYSEAASGQPASAARWMRLLDARDLRERADADKKIGRLREVRVAGRTSTGRVKALEVTGADGTVTFTGFAAIQRFLSPGSLRSTLFTLQPVYDGKNLSRLVVWGAGTGSGLGFSRIGAIGQAALGRDWRVIVKHYFPKFEIRDLNHPPAPPAPPVKGGLGPYKRTLNFRRKGAPTAAPDQKK